MENSIIIGEYPYPNKGTFLYRIGDRYFNVSHNQTREIKPSVVNRLLETFFRQS